MQAAGHPLIPRRRAAQIISISNTPTPTVEIQVGADPTVTVFVPFLESYSPTVSDYVSVLETQGDYLVLGKIATDNAIPGGVAGTLTITSNITSTTPTEAMGSTLTVYVWSSRTYWVETTGFLSAAVAAPVQANVNVRGDTAAVTNTSTIVASNRGSCQVVGPNGYQPITVRNLWTPASTGNWNLAIGVLNNSGGGSQASFSRPLIDPTLTVTGA